MKLWAQKYKSQRGFTIIELLIVIVIIAILAAITLVAYGNIQQRARNSSKIQAASALLRAVNEYTLATGQNLPGIPGCLPVGTADFNGDGVPDCNNVSATPPQTSEKAVMNTALANEKIKVAFPNDVITDTAGTKYTGISVTYSSGGYGVNGILQPYFLYFMLEGNNQDCGNGASVKVDGTQADLYKLVPARNYGYGYGVTICAYTINSAANL